MSAIIENDDVINLGGITKTQINKLKEIMLKLRKGQKRQHSSTKLMQNLVQDLLDYAQIKAGKFRKNTKIFNIKSTVQDVMHIQKHQAESKKIIQFS